MTARVHCQHCQRRMLVDESLAGKRVRCPDCHQVVAIPPRVSSPSLESVDASNIRVRCPHCKYGFMAPENHAGRHCNCPACDGSVPIVPVLSSSESHRLKDSSDTLGSSYANERFDESSNTELRPPTRSAKQKASAPSYGTQLRRNPLRLFLFGAKVGSYQKDTREGVHSERKRQFRFWKRLLIWSYCAGAVLVTLAAMSRNGVVEGLKLGGVSAILGLAPVACYLIGLLAYAGALFEWKSFVNSRRMRASRSLMGDQSARKLYLTLSRVVMTFMAGVLILGTLVFSLAFLLQKKDRRAGNAAGGQSVNQRDPLLVSAEADVIETRKQLLELAANVARFVANNETFQMRIKADPNNLRLRSEANKAFSSRLRLVIKFTNSKTGWQDAVSRLERFAEPGNRILEDNRTLPAECDFSREQLKPQLFPLNDAINHSSNCAGFKSRLKSKLNNPRTTDAQLEIAAEELRSLQETSKKLKDQFGFTGANVDERPIDQQLAEWKRTLKTLRAERSKAQTPSTPLQPRISPVDRKPRGAMKGPQGPAPIGWISTNDPFSNGMARPSTLNTTAHGLPNLRNSAVRLSIV